MIADTLTKIREHAAACFPLESCGLVVIRKGKERYWPCRNMARAQDHFQIDPRDYAQAEDTGDVVTIVHSHPNSAPQPSQADLVSCETTGLPWAIVNWPTGAVCEFQPSRYQAPLIGRVFSHGVLDCYSIIRDYYRETLSIVLPDFERQDDWWMTGADLYRDNFGKAGFYQIAQSDLRPHDVILMQLCATKTNHGAVYLGDGIILHHPMNRLSGRDPYGGFWAKITSLVLRHKDLP